MKHEEKTGNEEKTGGGHTEKYTKRSDIEDF